METQSLDKPLFSEMSKTELDEVSGGLIRSIAGGLIVHIALEAWNNWEIHRAEFDKGREFRRSR